MMQCHFAHLGVTSASVACADDMSDLQATCDHLLCDTELTPQNLSQWLQAATECNRPAALKRCLDYADANLSLLFM